MNWAVRDLKGKIIFSFFFLLKIGIFINLEANLLKKSQKKTQKIANLSQNIKHQNDA